MIYGQPVTFGGASGEIAINDNGTFDVKKYATANVNVLPVMRWENASPTSAFAAQAVSVPSGYPAYLVEFKKGATDNYFVIQFVPADGVERFYSVANAASASYGRYVTANNGNIVFSTAHGSGTARTTDAIPTRIWCVNFTL